MNVQPTNEIRELTAAELDAVSGGMQTTDTGLSGTSMALLVVLGSFVGGWLAGLIDELFS